MPVDQVPFLDGPLPGELLAALATRNRRLTAVCLRVHTFCRRQRAAAGIAQVVGPTAPMAINLVCLPNTRLLL